MGNWKRAKKWALYWRKTIMQPKYLQNSLSKIVSMIPDKQDVSLLQNFQFKTIQNNSFPRLFFLSPPTCNFLQVILLTTLSDCYENLHETYYETNNATTNIFSDQTQPRKITRYTNKLKLAWCGGKKKKSQFPFWKSTFSTFFIISHLWATEHFSISTVSCEQ